MSFVGIRWSPVKGYEGRYEISDMGDVKRLARIVLGPHGETRPLKEMLLKPNTYEYGHRYVGLTPDGVTKSRKIHRLVAEAFVLPHPEGTVVCHNDGDAGNNRFTNLRWDTQSSNQQDSVRQGTHRQTRKTHCPQGHEYTPENTKLRNGARFCRACQKANNKARYVDRRAALLLAKDAA